MENSENEEDLRYKLSKKVMNNIKGFKDVKETKDINDIKNDMNKMVIVKENYKKTFFFRYEIEFYSLPNYKRVGGGGGIVNKNVINND